MIETKNYKGWIIGDEHSDYWTQVIFHRKEKLFNPIKQNKGHLKALSELLERCEDIPIYPIVSFSSRPDLKINVESEVVYSTDLLKVINKYQDEVISLDDIDKITNIINQARLTDRSELKNRIQSIMEKNSVEAGICPRCGGVIVERKGKYGYFNGCSNFPKCRYTTK